ncbi:terminal uridylyltransferase Tailor [Bactrocera neohumeralis]|uniref:terminal uridylyltransferase Tailor n=1 Tax=Bactrocera tryoni TaxID=59916 RepID=UPI001A966771|nr:terminal uridylyltransferase Tailor [Bactrocera tryoni]XP_050341736.1 terminal uridylyltransferase Tailor [Bactrocera neohumeralis]
MEQEGGSTYLHPLTLESQLFLNSLETYSQKYNQIDTNLCDMLNNIVLGIQKFLDQNPEPIVATEKTKLVQRNDLAAIQSIYHCNICKKDLGKTADKAALHLVAKHEIKANPINREKKKAQKKAAETKLNKLPKKGRALVMGDFAKFFADQLQVAEKIKQIPEYEVIENALLTALKKAVPSKSIKLYKFGSRITGIGARHSDLDIYVDIGGQFNVFEQTASDETLNNYDRIYEVIKKSSIDWDQIRAIRAARVPIIRMTNRKTNIECDVGFSNSLSYCNTQLLEYIFQQQPLARRLCIFMKKWLERTRLNEHITTYCMALMVIYYLQVKKCLPSIETLQKNMLANVLVGPWIGNFNNIPLNTLGMQEIGVSPPCCKQHIKEFCQYYANFKYDLHVVCPYFGRPNIEIKNFENLMPERYTNYITNDNTATKEWGLQLNAQIVVQDPLQLNHNVAKRCSKLHLKELVDYLKQSAEILVDSN